MISSKSTDTFSFSSASSFPLSYPGQSDGNSTVQSPSVDPIYKAVQKPLVTGTPPSGSQSSLNSIHSKTRSDNIKQMPGMYPAPGAVGSAISSLERSQTVLRQIRSHSLTRHQPAHLSIGPEYPTNRSGSLERNAVRFIEPNQIESGKKGGSLERNLSLSSAYDLMKNRQMRGGSGSLERQNRNSLERNAQYNTYRSQMKSKVESEPVQEEIYDFGGANVKSCVSIANRKAAEAAARQPFQTFLDPALQQTPTSSNLVEYKQFQNVPTVWPPGITAPYPISAPPLYEPQGSFHYESSAEHQDGTQSLTDKQVRFRYLLADC